MSTRLQGLRERQAQIVKEMEDLTSKAGAEERDLTPEELTKFNELDGKVEELLASIAVEEKVIARKAALATVVANGDGTVAKVSPTLKRTGKLKSFKGEKAEENAYKSGMWLKAALGGDAEAQVWCKDNGVAILKAQSESINSSGGYLVPEEFNQTIIDLREEYGTFRKWARVLPMSSDTVIFPRRAGGVTAYFVAENAEITASDASWDQVRLSVKKLGALVKMSSELADDAVISVADWVANEIAYSFAVKEDSCGWNGDGTSTYGGIVGVRTAIIDGTHTKSAIDAASGHDTFAELDATDLNAVMAALPLYAVRNAKWYCSQTAFASVFQRLAQASGGMTKAESGSAAPHSYAGFPIVLDQTLPTAVTDISDTAMLFFGDLSLACTMGDRRGISLANSSDRYFEYDQTAIRGIERFDINVHDLGDNTNAGPLIALIGE